MKKKSPVGEIAALGCLVLAFMVLCVFIWKRANYMLDSDCSSEMVLAKLLAEEGGILSKSWHYSTEIRVLNTQLIWAVLFRFTNNWHLVRAAGSVVCYGLMVVSYLYLCKQLNMSKTAAYLSAAVLLLPTSELYRNYVLVNAAYIIYFIYSFSLFGLLLRAVRIRRWWEWITVGVPMAVLSIFAGMMGLRQFLVFYMPVIAAAVIWCIYRFFREKGAEKEKLLAVLKGTQGRFLIFSICAAAMAAIGYVYNVKVLSVRYNFLNFSTVEYTYFSWESMETIFNWCLEAVGYSADMGLFSALSYNAFAFFVLLVVILCLGSMMKFPERYPEEVQIIDIYFVIALLVLAAFYAFSDMVWGSARYVLPVLVFIVPVLTMHLSGKPGLHKKVAGGIIGGLLILNSLMRYEFFFRLDQTRDLRGVVEYVTGQGYTEGYSTFWNANVLTELSNGVVDMRSWLDSGDGSLMENVEDIDQTYNWLQLVGHTWSKPEGEFFLLLTHEERDYWPLSPYLPEENLVYQNEKYYVYGFESYEQIPQELTN